MTAPEPFIISLSQVLKHACWFPCVKAAICLFQGKYTGNCIFFPCRARYKFMGGRVLWGGGDPMEKGSVPQALQTCSETLQFLYKLALCDWLHPSSHHFMNGRSQGSLQKKLSGFQKPEVWPSLFNSGLLLFHWCCFTEGNTLCRMHLEVLTSGWAGTEDKMSSVSV